MVSHVEVEVPFAQKKLNRRLCRKIQRFICERWGRTVNKNHLGKTCSSTQTLTTEQPIAKMANDKFQARQSLRADEVPKAEGGLRTKGCIRLSYTKQGEQWYVRDADGQLTKPIKLAYESGCDILPLVTVVTVVFNAEKTLGEAIKSVIGQTYPNVEYIIVDGGSTDGTLDVIRKYEHAIDYWLSEPDGGIYDAMNKGISLARGQWIYFLGADDILLNKLHLLVSDFKTDKVYYGNVEIKQTGEVWGERVTKYSLMQRNIPHQALFYPASIFNGNIFDLRYRLLADWEFNFRTYGKYEERFEYVNTTIAVYNQSGVSSVQKDLVFEREIFQIIRKNFGFNYFLAKLARQYLASMYKRCRGFL